MGMDGTTQIAAIPDGAFQDYSKTNRQGRAVLSTMLAGLKDVASRAMSSSDVIALTSTAASGLTSTDVSLIVSSQISALTPESIGSLTSTAISTLVSTGVSSITITGIGGLSSTAIGALTSTQVPNLGAATQLGLTSTQVDRIHAAATTTEVANLDASQIRTGIIDLARLPSASIVEHTEVADEAALRALTSATVQNDDHVRVLTVGSLSSSYWRVFDDTKLPIGAGDLLTAFTPLALASTWPAILNKPPVITAIESAMTSTQAEALSSLNVNSVATTTQLAALAASSLTGLTTTQQGALRAVADDPITQTEVESLLAGISATPTISSVIYRSASNGLTWDAYGVWDDYKTANGVSSAGPFTLYSGGGMVNANETVDTYTLFAQSYDVSLTAGAGTLGSTATVLGSAALSTSIKNSGVGSMSCPAVGSGTYIAANSFALTTSDTVSVGAWVYPTSRSVYGFIAGVGTDGSIADCSVYTSLTTGYLTGVIAGTTIYSTTAVPLNAWSHVAVWRAGGAVYLGMGGTIVATGTNSTAMTAGTRNIYFGTGTRNRTTNESFVGYVDSPYVKIGASPAVSGSTYTIPSPFGGASAGTFVTTAATAPATAISGNVAIIFDGSTVVASDITIELSRDGSTWVAATWLAASAVSATSTKIEGTYSIAAGAASLRVRVTTPAKTMLLRRIAVVWS